MPYTKTKSKTIEAKQKNEEKAIQKWLQGEKFTYSHGICGNLTAGYGELSFNGYWEYPLPSKIINLIRNQNKPIACDDRL